MCVCPLWLLGSRSDSSCSQHNCSDCFAADQSAGRVIVGSGSCRSPLAELSETENFRMSHDVSAPWVALSHKSELTGRAGWDLIALFVSSSSQNRRQAPTTCWHCSFSSTQTATRRNKSEAEGAKPSSNPITSHPAGRPERAVWLTASALGSAVETLCLR